MGIKKHLISIYRKYFSYLVVNKPLWIESGTRKRTKVNWGMIAQTDITDKFLKLTKGLDDESIRVVSRVLARYKVILASNKMFLSLLTKAERQELRDQKEYFEDEIVQLSDDTFAWQNYLLPIKDFGANVFYYKYGTNEVETIDRVKGKTIIDAGGFIGDSALFFENLKPEKICVFEASPDTYKLLKRTIELNGLKNVVAENMAVGAEKGELPLYVGVSARTTGIVKGDAVPYQKEVKVPVISLDEYVAEHNIDNIGLIKVDIEGAEPDFLAGAKKTICEQKPILLLSIYHNAHDFFELKPLIESWNVGYKFKIYKPTLGGSVVRDTLLIAEVV